MEEPLLMKISTDVGKDMKLMQVNTTHFILQCILQLLIPYLHKSYKYISRDLLMFGINMMNSSHTVCCAWVNGWVRY